MIDLGTLGGTVGGPGAQGSILVNNRGQVIGTSNLAGDLVTHPFLWDRGVLTDLGTLGGDNGFPIWINDAGEIVGEADLPGSSISLLHHAFLWRNGVMTDLGTLGSTNHAEAINSRRQVVGRSRLGFPTSILQHAFLWEDGGPMIDLNTLIPANSSLQLTDAVNINERGEILCQGLPAGVQITALLFDSASAASTHGGSSQQTCFHAWIAWIAALRQEHRRGDAGLVQRPRDKRGEIARGTAGKPCGAGQDRPRRHDDAPVLRSRWS
jgi:probable HAF family extracellular repeat protein